MKFIKDEDGQIINLKYVIRIYIDEHSVIVIVKEDECRGYCLYTSTIDDESEREIDCHDFLDHIYKKLVGYVE